MIGILEFLITLAIMPVIVLIALAVHEAGHYLAARLVNMKVERVVLGFGKRLWSYKAKTGTVWHVHLWPFRAHVGIEEFDPHKEWLWRRLLVVLAGPLANMVFPVFIMTAFFVFFGKPVSHTIVTAVEVDFPAYEAGIEPGDQILSIEGIPVKNGAEIRPFVEVRAEKPLRFEIRRGEEILIKEFAPRWVEYRDQRGLEQSHGRIGISIRQLPFEFDAVARVNGIETKDNDDARDLVRDHLGQRAVIGLNSTDLEIHDYIVDLDKEANQALFHSDERDYDYFYMGKLKDNYYQSMSFTHSLMEAGSRTAEFIVNVLKVPFQLFPIDKDWLTGDEEVSDRSSAMLYYMYKTIFLLSLLSILIGFINLLPFPGLDGSYALIDTVEAFKGEELTPRGKAMWISGALIVFYAAVLSANAPDMEGYFEFLIDKATKSE